MQQTVVKNRHPRRAEPKGHQVERVLFSPLEVARMLGYSRARIYQLIQEGALPHVVIRAAGNNIRIPRAAIDQLISEAMANSSRQKTDEPN